MKNFIIVILLILFCINAVNPIYSQQLKDVSKDDKLINTYFIDKEHVYGIVERRSLEAPYGLAPDWITSLERQAGGMAFGDYDNDGDLDLAVGCYYSNSYPPINDYENLIFKNENGILSLTPSWISTEEKSTMEVKWADINSDGKPDLLSVNGDGAFSPSSVYLNGSSGISTTPSYFITSNAWSVGSAFCDVDGDGDLDVAFGTQALSPNPYKPITLSHNINGTISSSPTWISADQMITNTISFGDLNNDNLTRISNLVFSCDGNRHVFHLPMLPLYSIDSVLINGSITNNFCYDPINGWISLGVKPTAGSTVSISYRYISKGDLAGSKWVNFASGIYFNQNGALNTLPGWNTGITNGQRGIAWADFDKDGFMDLVVAGSSIPTYLYKNVNGTLTGPVWNSNATNNSPQDLITGDVNNDGYPDLAIVHFGEKRIELFLNHNGILDSTFSWKYTAPNSATTIAFGDVNGDGRLDLAIGTARNAGILFLNKLLPIPVELTSFNAINSDNKVELIWTTASEKNNAGFEIERKKITWLDITKSSQNEDNLNWKSVAFIHGHGTTSNSNKYSYVDENLTIGKYAYRIKQIDFDGRINYSSNIEIEVLPPAEFSLFQNYPNPFNPSTRIRYSLNKPKKVMLKVLDILGNEITTLVDKLQEPGIYTLEFNAQDPFGGKQLTSGVYIYQMNVENMIINRKMILLR
jgi:hypothetical protein